MSDKIIYRVNVLVYSPFTPPSFAQLLSEEYSSYYYASKQAKMYQVFFPRVEVFEEYNGKSTCIAVWINDNPKNGETLPQRYRCWMCGKRLDKMVGFEGKYYCLDCFKCHRCGADTEYPIEYNDKFYCPDCLSELMGD